MPRLIDADALLEAMRKEDVLKVYECIQLVNNAPTVQRDGWVSVPVEPTHDMLSASLGKFYEGGTYLVYKAMIQAAPTAV